MILVAWYYIGWFGCVFLGRAGYQWPCFLFPVVSFILLIWHLQRKLSPPRNTIFQILAMAVGLASIGIGFDALMVNQQQLVFLQTQTLIFGLPGWMLAIWFLFAALLPVTVELLGSRLLLAAVLGAVFGPLSYKSGESLNVMSTFEPSALLCYALFWGLFFPFSLVCLGRLNFRSKRQ